MMEESTPTEELVMSLNNLFVLLFPVFLVLFWHDPVSARRAVGCQETQTQTQAAAKLKQSQFVRVSTATGREVSGHFRSFDGSRLVLEDKRNHRMITVE